jgi:hypothetical protein
MSTTMRTHVYPLICLLGLASCGSGGDGNTPPPPAGDTTRRKRTSGVDAAGAHESAARRPWCNDGASVPPSRPASTQHLSGGWPTSSRVRESAEGITLPAAARDAAGNVRCDALNYQWTVDPQPLPIRRFSSTTGAISPSADATFTLLPVKRGAARLKPAWMVCGLFPVRLDVGAHGFSPKARHNRFSVRAIDSVTNVDPTRQCFCGRSTPPHPTDGHGTNGAKVQFRQCLFPHAGTSTESGQQRLKPVSTRRVSAVSSTWALTISAEGAH